MKAYGKPNFLVFTTCDFISLFIYIMNDYGYDSFNLDELVYYIDTSIDQNKYSKIFGNVKSTEDIKDNLINCISKLNNYLCKISFNNNYYCYGESEQEVIDEIIDKKVIFVEEMLGFVDDYLEYLNDKNMDKEDNIKVKKYNYLERD